MAQRITDYVNYTATELSGQVAADALNYAETIADATFDFPSDPWQLGQGYLDTDNRKWRKKIGFVAGYTTTGKPIVTIVNQKTGETTTFTPSYTPTFTPPRQAPKISNIQTCPTCSKHHDGKHPKCYYCYIDGLYQQASPPTNHPYLAKKGISLSLAMSLGIKESNGKLIIPLTGGNGGYQVVYPHGGKFTAVPDGMAGMYVPVGWLSSSRIYICEGVATAVSAHLALDHGVVAALSTANLGHVVGHFRQKYPDAEIIILADNDIGSHFRKTADNPTGTKNPGKTIAYEVACDHGCLVSLPPTYDKADWNDYYLTHGNVATKQAINNNLRTPNLSWDKLEGDKTTIVRINQPYLSQNLIDGIEGRIFIKSGLGTGKTTNIIKPTCEAQGTTRLYAHRQALMRNLSDTVGADCYLDIDDLAGIMGIDYGEDMAVCINSITNPKYSLALPPDKVIVDEVEGVLASIANGTVDNKEAVFTALVEQLNQAQFSLLADADLRPETVEILNQGYEGATTIIINEYQPYRDRKLYFYDDKGDWLAALKKAVADNQNIAMPSGASIKSTEAIIDEVTSGPSIYINSETANQHEGLVGGLKAGSYAEYQLMAYSATWLSGIDVNDRQRGHFGAVFGVFEGQLSSTDIFQMIGRIRSDCPVHIYAPVAGIYRKGLAREGVLKEKLKAHEDERQAIMRKATHIRIEAPEITPCIDMQISLQLTRNEDLSNLRENTLTHAKGLGCTVRFVAKNDANSVEKTAVKQRKKAIAAKEYEAIAEAHNTDPLHDVEVDRLEGATKQERYRIAGRKVANLYGKEEITASDVAKYEDDRKAVKRLGFLLANEDDVISKAYEEHASTDTTFVEQRYHYNSWEHKRKIIELLGGSFEPLDVSIVEYDHDSLWGNTALVDYLSENQDSINGSSLGATVTNFTLLRESDGKACRGLTVFVGHVLRNCGFTVVSKQSTTTRKYSVCQPTLEKTTRLLATNTKILST